MAGRVLVEKGLDAVEHGAAEGEGLLLVDHGHEEEDEYGTGRLRRGSHPDELRLIIVVGPDSDNTVALQTDIRLQKM